MMKSSVVSAGPGTGLGGGMRYRYCAEAGIDDSTKVNMIINLRTRKYKIFI